MSKWETFKAEFGKFADKTVNKTRDLTDLAALKIKIANKEAERDTEYKNLGKLTYAKLKKLDGTDPQTVTKEISDILEKLDAINQAIASLKAEEKAKKDARDAAKEAERQAKQAKEEDNEEEKLVMDMFNEARAEADAEYEKAKQAAEDVKQ